MTATLDSQRPRVRDVTPKVVFDILRNTPNLPRVVVYGEYLFEKSLDSIPDPELKQILVEFLTVTNSLVTKDGIPPEVWKKFVKRFNQKLHDKDSNSVRIILVGLDEMEPKLLLEKCRQALTAWHQEVTAAVNEIRLMLPEYCKDILTHLEKWKKSGEIQNVDIKTISSLLETFSNRIVFFDPLIHTDNQGYFETVGYSQERLLHLGIQVHPGSQPNKALVIHEFLHAVLASNALIQNPKKKSFEAIRYGLMGSEHFDGRTIEEKKQVRILGSLSRLVDQRKTFWSELLVLTTEQLDIISKLQKPSNSEKKLGFWKLYSQFIEFLHRVDEEIPEMNIDWESLRAQWQESLTLPKDLIKQIIGLQKKHPDLSIQPFTDFYLYIYPIDYSLVQTDLGKNLPIAHELKDLEKRAVLAFKTKQLSALFNLQSKYIRLFSSIRKIKSETLYRSPGLSNFWLNEAVTDFLTEAIVHNKPISKDRLLMLNQNSSSTLVYRSEVSVLQTAVELGLSFDLVKGAYTQSIFDSKKPGAKNFKKELEKNFEKIFGISTIEFSALIEAEKARQGAWLLTISDILKQLYSSRQLLDQKLLDLDLSKSELLRLGIRHGVELLVFLLENTANTVFDIIARQQLESGTTFQKLTQIALSDKRAVIGLFPGTISISSED